VPRFVLPFYDVLDFHAGITHDNYTASFYVKNLTNERGMLGDSSLTLANIGPYAVTIIPPRTYGLSLTMSF
jgi:outer membrane receptor protein involved in Fe transport